MNEFVLYLRTRAPSGLRSLYRALRSFSAVQPSRHLPDDLLSSCRFVSSRRTLLNVLPHEGRIAELGTYRGEFARFILDQCSPRELHLIDLDLSRLDQRVALDRRVTAHKGQTHEVISKFPDDYFDWIYLDADHSYDGTIRDAYAAARHVRQGGYLVFGDFAHIDTHYGRYGVHRAVVDFAIDKRWLVKFFAFDPSGLYEIALQRP